MKKLLFLTLLIAVVTSAYSQDYDLIIKTNGDSMACKIDSISDASVYFKMKHNNHWIHTFYDKDSIAEYQYNAINYKNYLYKPGTSYILSALNQSTTVRDMQKNSIYLESFIIALGVNYERIIPVGNKTGLLAGVGVIQSFFESDGIPVPVAKPGIIIGNGKHFIEGYFLINLSPKNEDLDLLMPALGYRYQGPRGFLFRADLGTSSDIAILLGISLGYSF